MVGTISQLARPCQFNPKDSDEEDEFDARNVAQRRSIEDALHRRLRVTGVSQDVSQVSLPASTEPASSTAVREVCEHLSRVEDEEFRNGFEEDLTAQDLC